jgi:hypothetical protein
MAKVLADVFGVLVELLKTVDGKFKTLTGTAAR